MAKKFTRAIATTLVLAMCTCAFPLQALAAEETPDVKETTKEGVTTRVETTTKTEKDSNGDVTVTVTVKTDTRGTNDRTGITVTGSKTKKTSKTTDSNGKKTTKKVSHGYEKTEKDNGIADVTVKVPTTAGQKDENKSNPVNNIPTEGDVAKGENDTKYDYTETKIEAGTVKVETGKVEVTEDVTSEDKLEYTSSVVTPTDDNDLVYAPDGVAPEEYLPGYEGETKVPEKVEGYDYVYVGSGNTSKLVPAVVFTEPMTDEEKIAEWGDHAYIGSSYSELWVNFLSDPSIAARDEAGKLVKDADGFVLDKDGNRILKEEFSTVGPDGKTYYMHRIDNLGEGHFVEGWYVDGEWKEELNAPADTDENGNPVLEKVQLVDKDGNPVVDEDGNPVFVEIGKINQWTNKKVNGNTISGPLGGLIKDADGNVMVNYMAVWSGPQQFILVDSEGNTITTYCADVTTPTEKSFGYNVENLEDATYYDEEAAKMIRTIAKNGYWGTESDEGSLEYMKQEMLKSGKFTAEELESLTDGVALTATQMAIWSCSNKMSGVEFINAHYSNWGTGNVPEDKEDEVKLMFKLYDYLMNLAPTEVKGTTADTIINADNFIKDMELTVVKKAEDHENNKDKDKTNDAYVTNLTFALVVEIDENNGDQLKVSIVNGKGEPVLGPDGKPIVGRIAGELQEGEVLLTNNNGNYCFENITMVEGDSTFKLNLEGIQNLEQGVYLYSSEVRVDEESGEGVSSQTLVGLAGGKRGVNVTMDLTFSLDVEDEVVVKERYWHSESKNVTPPPADPNNPPPPPDVPEDPKNFELNKTNGVVEIPEEQVPLAAAPKTGDISMIWIAMAMAAAITLCASNFGKKRETETF